MKMRYQILDCEIDFTEQTLVRAGEVYKQQHKVMQVLRCLLQKQGELVSIEELMREVWPNTVVSPNTLQRCVAQLRKGLGDSSQAQNVIKTYPRRGYALIAAAQVIDNQTASTQEKQNNTEQLIPSIQASTKASNRSNRKAWVMSASACSVMFLLVITMIDQLHVSTESVEPKRAYVTSVMTASDAHTGQPRYAPNGKHLVFQRYSDFCESTVWLQHVENKEETALTQLNKQINDVAWSADGKQLLMAQSNPCVAPSHEQCWQLERLTLDDAMQLTNTQSIGSCEHRPISQVAWLNEQTALFIEKTESGQKQIAEIDLQSGQKKTLFASGDVVSFTLLNDSHTLAVLSHQGSGQLTLYTVNELGEVLHNTPLHFDEALSVFSWSKLSYVSNEAQLLLENNGQLFEITDDGSIRKYVTLPNNLFDFSLSNDVMTATRGQTKKDGTLHNLHNDAQTVLFPSKSVETDFRFAPHSEAIAFVSNRTESLQIWVSDNSTSAPKQLSQFKTPKNLSGIEWLRTGESLLLVINDQLSRLNLAGELEIISLPMKIKYLYQTLPNNQALIEYQHDFQEVVATIDLETLNITPIHAGLFNDVQLDAQGNLWFIDRAKRLNKLVAGELTQLQNDSKIIALRANKQGVTFSDKNGVLFYVSAQHSEPEKLYSIGSGAWLQDIKAEQFISSYKHARNSDIVELAVEE